MVYKIKKSEMLHIQADEKVIGYQAKMMREVGWLLPFSWEEEQLCYQKSKGKTLLEWLKAEPNEEELLAVIAALGRVQKDIEQYLLDWDKLIWDAEWIFWDSEERKLRLAYCPWDRGTAVHTDVFKGLAKLLWQKAVWQRWVQKDLILLIFEFNAQVIGKELVDWQDWAERRQRMQKKEETETALDVLMQEAPKKEKKTILQIWKEKFPFVLR
ncbi:MAG: hypothetical protein HFE64_05070 [Lachnospiraceae bacterium]|jgi:hypothetical protein|nr:hypothetical protein [Lachnospiraceae bacterium]